MRAFDFYYWVSLSFAYLTMFLIWALIAAGIAIVMHIFGAPLWAAIAVAFIVAVVSRN